MPFESLFGQLIFQHSQETTVPVLRLLAVLNHSPELDTIEHEVGRGTL